MMVSIREEESMSVFIHGCGPEVLKECVIRAGVKVDDLEDARNVTFKIKGVEIILFE